MFGLLFFAIQLVVACNGIPVKCKSARAMWNATCALVSVGGSLHLPFSCQSSEYFLKYQRRRFNIEGNLKNLGLGCDVNEVIESSDDLHEIAVLERGGLFNWHTFSAYQ